MTHKNNTLKAIVTIDNEVTVSITGLTKSHQRDLYEQFALYANNYIFNPLVKLGRWDGRIEFFKYRSGTTYVNLLPDVLRELREWGYEISINDKRVNEPKFADAINDHILSDTVHPDWGVPIVLRSYQVDGVNALIENGGGICLASTGAGKTFMCAALVKAHDINNHKTITVVPDLGLVRQTLKWYKLCGLDAGEYSGDAKEVTKSHIVSTWQSLQNNPGFVRMFDAIIVDEAHGSKASVLSKIITEQCTNMSARYGFTGSLPEHETDRMTIRALLGDVQYTVTARDLIDAGVLADLHVDIFQLTEDLTKQYDEYCQEATTIGEKAVTYKDFKEQYFADFSAEHSYLGLKENRLQYIANTIIKARSRPGSGNTLCLVNNIATARKLGKLIPGSYVVNGTDVKNASDREEIYKLFATNDDIVVIATVKIASTGLDIPRIFNMVLVDIGKSFIRIVQSIGRGIRKAKDKDSVNIIDICSDLKYSKRHLAKRVSILKQQQYPFKKYRIKYEQVADPGVF